MADTADTAGVVQLSEELATQLRVQAVDESHSPNAKLKALAPEEHSWRTRELLKSNEHMGAAHALLDKKGADATKETRLQGLAHFVLGMFHGWGYSMPLVDTLLLATNALQVLNAATASRPSADPTQPRYRHIHPADFSIMRTMEITLGTIMINNAPATEETKCTVAQHQGRVKNMIEKLDDRTPIFEDYSFGEVAGLVMEDKYGLSRMQLMTVLLWAAATLGKKGISFGQESPHHKRSAELLSTGTALLCYLHPEVPFAQWLVAETLDILDGPTKDTKQAFLLTVEACESTGDELVGALAAWNAASSLMDGREPYSKALVEKLLRQAEAWGGRLKGLGLYEQVGPRFRMLRKLKREFEKAVKKAGATDAEDAMLPPWEPSAAFSSGAQQAAVPVIAPSKPYLECDGCQKLFSVLHDCGACKQASYCSKACQKQAWASHKKACRTVIQEAAAAQVVPAT